MNTDTARQAVTYDEVSEAATGLQDEGKQVTIEAVREVLGNGSPAAIQKHLIAWRASNAKPVETPKAELPPALLAELANWAQQFAEQSGAGARDALAQSESDMAALVEAGEALEAERDELLGQVTAAATARDQAQALVTELNEEIDRLNAELRNARQIATDALVGKAKDQLAIDGKEAQLVELRAQLERYVASSAAESDARLAAEMELVGAKTARDSLEAEIKDLRKKLDTARTERSNLKAELEGLRARF